MIFGLLSSRASDSHALHSAARSPTARPEAATRLQRNAPAKLERHQKSPNTLKRGEIQNLMRMLTDPGPTENSGLNVAMSLRTKVVFVGIPAMSIPAPAA